MALGLLLYHSLFSTLGSHISQKQQCGADETVLSNGLVVPRYGYGTASLDNDYEGMGWALDAGIKLIDTASMDHPVILCATTRFL